MPKASVEPAPTPTGRIGRLPRWSHWDNPVTSYYLLVGTTALLLAIGLVMVLSSSSIRSLALGGSPYRIFLSQAQFALMGLPLLILASRLRPQVYKRLAWAILIGAVGMQCLIFTGLAKNVNGNTNWVEFGGLTVQPSEIAKLALAIWLAAVLARKHRLLTRWGHVAVPAVPVITVVLGLVLAGNDLGTAMVLILLVCGALFVAGVPLRMFAAGGVVLLGVVAALVIASDNRISRISHFFGATEDDPSGLGYQTKHGLQGLGTGGLSGVGLGAGKEKWSYLPEAHNDFIFSVLGEELGLLGTLLVLALFALLGVAMLRVVRRHPDPFVKIATAGIGCWVVGQALINIGVVIGLVPVIGVPLPLVSAGGSALIMTMTALGVVIGFARDEPGAREALTARGGSVRRGIAVVGGKARDRIGRRRGHG